MNSIIIINGPNLNLLGRREPEIYGKVSFEEYLNELELRFPNLPLIYHQSNHEGAIIDWLHEYGFSPHGIILNAGALTHTSIAIADAIKAITTPVAEVHLSDLSKRESFRQKNYLTDCCVFSVQGMGLEGYAIAVDYFLAFTQGKSRVDYTAD
nr:3-dehydroquinate dehydratase [Saprospiraceae bacterium]